ncbi:hypothetical protein BDA96_01G055300 [Sorghum bicolor]|uniref:Uncharacterized protein n=2 Tax=Sorghum bicolor TaxID=4558 RepID=A0A921RWC7_SORBI|nr:hypothetical protein BDA96_01G055300 [Sorghum bicolor]OQU90829.1 hypothetical protein SORBI_3001G054050 [Sorghum bicolor]
MDVVMWMTDFCLSHWKTLVYLWWTWMDMQSSPISIDYSFKVPFPVLHNKTLLSWSPGYIY